MTAADDIAPTEEQARAIDQIVRWYGAKNRQEFYLAGFAGVGKSTIANVAIQELRDSKGISDVRVAAYTGKAASVLRRKGIEEAQTVHSLIYVPVIDEATGELTFKLSQESPAAGADLIVLDECSMVDDKLADDLRSFGKKILVMGDPAQLPPVNGQGAFTRREPDAFLREIHRQCADSPILELATLARQGKPLPANYQKGDVRVLPLTKETQPLIYGENTQAICGLNRVRWEYNKRIRARRGFSGMLPQVGERVICCRNNWQKGLFNGGLGVLRAIAEDVLQVASAYHDIYRMDVEMEDLPDPLGALKVDPYLFQCHFTNGAAKKIEFPPGKGQRLNEFDFGYVLTCHKAQGSSWGHVTVIDDSSCFRENRWNWLYTAITRAENGLTVLTR